MLVVVRPGRSLHEARLTHHADDGPLEAAQAQPTHLGDRGSEELQHVVATQAGLLPGHHQGGKKHWSVVVSRGQSLNRLELVRFRHTSS